MVAERLPTFAGVNVLEVIAMSVGVVKAVSLDFCHLTIVPLAGDADKLLDSWLPAQMV